MGPAPALSLYGVWIPRGGDNGRFSLEVVANGGAKIIVQLFHKDFSDMGDGTSLGSSITFDGTNGRTTQEWVGVKQLVRFLFTVTPYKTKKAGEFGWVLFRFLQPSWF